ncbi:MAG: branched-chain amino acid ABC transporter permease [Chloroflexi bacterium]|nr:branched-chain amino acid ABC transporter permease [Chloroflexota bacterium]
MLLFLLAAGLSVIFGMMDFINLAHGSFYMLGAYMGFTATQRLGNFWFALIIVPIIVAALGFLLERILLRPLYKRGHLDQVLLTFGLAFVVADLVKWTWGADIRSVAQPPELTGAVSLGITAYPRYRTFVIVAGLVLALALWALQARTRIGAIVRAGVADKEMVGGLGINVQLVFGGVFAFGAGLAALSGVIAAPFLSLAPGMDFEQLILSLIVVVVGGLGTLKGAFFGAIVVGLADTFGKIWVPDFSLMVIFAIMAFVLLLRPNGLFGRAVA